jgi:hypothetical protein
MHTVAPSTRPLARTMHHLFMVAAAAVALISCGGADCTATTAGAVEPNHIRLGLPNNYRLQLVRVQEYLSNQRVPMPNWVVADGIHPVNTTEPSVVAAQNSTTTTTTVSMFGFLYALGVRTEYSMDVRVVVESESEAPAVAAAVEVHWVFRLSGWRFFVPTNVLRFEWRLECGGGGGGTAVITQQNSTEFAMTGCGGAAVTTMHADIVCYVDGDAAPLPAHIGVAADDTWFVFTPAHTANVTYDPVVRAVSFVPPPPPPPPPMDHPPYTSLLWVLALLAMCGALAGAGPLAWCLWPLVLVCCCCRWGRRRRSPESSGGGVPPERA